MPLLFSEIVRGDQNKLCCGTDVQRLSKRSTRCISKLKRSKSCSRLPAAALPASCTLCTLAVPPGAWRSVRCLIDLSTPAGRVCTKRLQVSPVPADAVFRTSPLSPGCFGAQVRTPLLRRPRRASGRSRGGIAVGPAGPGGRDREGGAAGAPQPLPPAGGSRSS